MSSPRPMQSSSLPVNQTGCAPQGGHCNAFHSNEQGLNRRDHADHSHDPSHSHHSDHSDHSHHSHGLHGDLGNIGFKLKVSTAVTILFVFIGVVAGYFADSLALISDAAHNFTDALSLILALFAVWLQKRPASATKTYGYHRAGILAAFINSSSLLLISVGIFYESVERIISPQPVEASLMLLVAIAGLAVNIGIGAALHRESKSDITIRSAYIHMLGDAAGTVGIIIGSIAIHYTSYWIIDPIISIAIGLLVLWTAWDILKETVNLLLEGTPKGIDLDSVCRTLETVSGVRAVHHVHIWAIASRVTALSCHIEADDENLSNCSQILLDSNRLLKERFQIEHATIQLETRCAENELAGCCPRTR